MQLFRKFTFFCCIIVSYHASNAASVAESKADAVEFNGIRYTVKEAQAECTIFLKMSSHTTLHN